MTTHTQGVMYGGAKKAAKKTGDLIISKTRTKEAAKKCNVSSDFYAALDKKVREMIAAAGSPRDGQQAEDPQADRPLVDPERT